VSALVDALQRALAAEHQAVYGYETLGPRSAPAAQDLARTCQSAHEGQRDAIEELVAAAGTRPVAGAAQYALVTSLVNSPRTLAARLEDGCAAAWRYVYAVACGAAGEATSAAATPSASAGRAPAAGDVRRIAQRALTESAVRAVRWRAGAPGPVVQAFPGS
jgi:Domain of unknown function (DUF4439)